ncbi:hypothetical protein Golob_022619 [Gossypium lobatum]|uniref:RNase H type-1 domain-containing protein n=1 Tax=Gossypium lobatum TaxID=34289 RepID=A0A7J8LHL0_9ROSI|nr:hypothetical protein [Gossypium lobatum]
MENSRTKRSCTGVVIRNLEGIVLGSRMIINSHIPSDFAAEALACFQAVQMGLDLGFLEAVIEGDALIVVKKFYANNQDGYSKRRNNLSVRGGAFLAIDEVEKDSPCIILHIE